MYKIKSLIFSNVNSIFQQINDDVERNQHFNNFSKNLQDLLNNMYFRYSYKKSFLSCSKIKPGLDEKLAFAPRKEKKKLHLLIGSLLKMRRKTCKQPSD